MSNFEKSFYKLISFSRSKISLNIFNFITNNDNSIFIMPNLYLGNINAANDIDFLQKNQISSIVNCSNEIEFHEYFKDKNKFRLSINDNKEQENIKKFQENIFDALKFIDYEINKKRVILVHCYYGLMRSATVIAAYLIVKYKMSVNDAVEFLKKKNKMIFNRSYNFIEILEYVHKIHNI
jgi:protein-tyrosine phosphatase